MENNVIIKSDMLTVAISKRGAEMQSVTGKNGTEFLWYGDKNVWSGNAPILFPICGGLKEDKYLFNGNEYTLPKHGFARLSDFEVEEATDTKAVFLLKSDDETKKGYPFDFELRAIYELDGNTVKVSYRVKNTSAYPMYFSVGAHEAYNCPDGIEEYDVIFEKEETLNSYQLDGNLLSNDTICVMENDTVFPLKYKYFEIDALVFKEVKSRAVTLSQRNGSKQIKVLFPDHDYLLIWTKPNGKYICIEPWCGIPDGVGSGYDIEKKEGIICIAPDEEYEAVHTIEFNEN